MSVLSIISKLYKFVYIQIKNICYKHTRIFALEESLLFGCFFFIKLQTFISVITIHWNLRQFAEIFTQTLWVLVLLISIYSFLNVLACNIRLKYYIHFYYLGIQFYHKWFKLILAVILKVSWRNTIRIHLFIGILIRITII